MKFTLPLVSFIKHLSQVSGVAGAPGGKDDITQNVLISIKNNLYSISLSFSFYSPSWFPSLFWEV